MIVVRDGLMFCQCCMLAAVNGDACECCSSERIDRGLDSMGPNLVPDFSEGEGEEEFSWCECACCGTRLGGARYRFAVLGEEAS